MLAVTGAVVVAFLGIASGNGIVRKARAYAAAEERYRERRERLLARDR